MRARNGNLSHQGGRTSDTLDFTFLENLNGPYGPGYGVDYINAGGSDRVIGTRFDDSFTLSSGSETIDGRGGNDTVNYRLSTAAVKVDLNVTLQTGAGYAAGDRLTNIENVTGSNYGDKLIGNAAANVLQGLAGDDFISGGGGDDTLKGGDGDDRLLGGSGSNSIEGGNGIDTVDYSASAFAVAVGGETGTTHELLNLNFNGNVLDIDFENGLILHDTLSDIENVAGSRFNDMLAGDAGTNVLSGGAGDDAIFGKGGSDIEKGGEGNDWLGTYYIELAPGVGFLGDDSGDDQLFGEAGDDTLFGGTGFDVMNGGDGIDTVDYSWAPDPVVVNLFAGQDGTASQGGGSATSWSNGDTYVSIERVIGSSFGDLIFGSNNGDFIDGGSENDTLFGVGGGDTLIGGAGVDQIEGGDGNDTMTGGTEADTFIFRSLGSSLFQSPRPGDGHDTILDFEIGVDRLGFVGAELADLAIEQVGAGTRITYADGEASITLQNVSADELRQHIQTDLLFG